MTDNPLVHPWYNRIPLGMQPVNQGILTTHLGIQCTAASVLIHKSSHSRHSRHGQVAKRPRCQCGGRPGPDGTRHSDGGQIVGVSWESTGQNMNYDDIWWKYVGNFHGDSMMGTLNPRDICKYMGTNFQHQPMCIHDGKAQPNNEPANQQWFGQLGGHVAAHGFPHHQSYTSKHIYCTT